MPLKLRILLQISHTIRLFSGITSDLYLCHAGIKKIEQPERPLEELEDISGQNQVKT